MEFSYFGAPEPTPKEQLYTEIVDDLRGSDPCIGSGSQVLLCSITTFCFMLLQLDTICCLYDIENFEQNMIYCFVQLAIFSRYSQYIS